MCGGRYPFRRLPQREFYGSRPSGQCVRTPQILSRLIWSACLLACSLACFLPQLHGQYTTCVPPLGSARETAPLEWRARPASQARGVESHCHSCSRANDEASILGHRTHLWLELLRGFSLKGAKELLSCPPYGCVSARVGCTTGNTGIRGHGSAQAILRWGWVQ